MSNSAVEVYKFGGAAVGTAEAIRIAGEHVRKIAPRVAVVVSAMNGVTDLLLGAAQAAVRGERIAYVTATKQFESRHNEIIDKVIAQRSRNESLKRKVIDAALRDALDVRQHRRPARADARAPRTRSSHAASRCWRASSSAISTSSESARLTSTPKR